MRKLLILLLSICCFVLPARAGDGRIQAVQLQGQMDGTLTVKATLARNVTVVQLEVTDAQGHRLLVRGGLKPRKGQLQFQEKLAYPVQAWSAENPVTYSLAVLAYTSVGPMEKRYYPFAFRTEEWRRNKLILNGKAVRLKGLRETSLLPEGEASEGDLLYAIRELKQLNINAVSADYRPADTRWSTLCDRFGLYVVPAEWLDPRDTSGNVRELRHRYRDIRTSGTPDNLQVTNGCSFRDLLDVRMRWSLESDGEAVDSGVVDWLRAGPGETQHVDLGIRPQRLSALPGTLTLTLRYELTRDRSLLPAGTEIAHEQLLLRDLRPALMDCEGGEVRVSDEAGTCVLSGPDWAFTFDKRTGGLVSWQWDGRELLAGPLLPDGPDAPLQRFEVFPLEQGWGAEVFFPAGSIFYQLAADGTLSVVTGLGLRMALPNRYCNVDFLGLGPWETLPGNCDAALLGRYRQSVSEAGVHTGLRFFRLLDASGTGLELVSPLDFMAWVRSYTPDGRFLTDLRLASADDPDFRLVLRPFPLSF